MNCKPGDLAFIVVSNMPANIGAVVEVLEACPLRSMLCETHIWIVRACRPLETDIGTLAEKGAIADFELRPISGVPLNDEVTDDIKEPA